MELGKRIKRLKLDRRFKQWSKPLRYALLLRSLKLIRWVTPKIPHGACLWVGGWMGRIVYIFAVPFRKRAARQLLDRKMAENEAVARAMTKEIFRNMGMNAMEWLHTVNWQSEDYAKHMNWDALEIAKSYMAAGRGVMFVNGHIGSWEFFLRASIHWLEKPLGVVWAEMRHPGLNQWLCEMRDVSKKAKWISVNKGSLGILRHLKNGGGLAIMVDQDSERSPGIFVDFFGEPAYTASAPAKLAWRANCVMIPVAVARDPDNPRYHRVLAAEPILPNLEADEDSETLRMTAEFTAALERHIRATPTQWVWFHDRWRHKPGDRIQVRSAGKKFVQT